jgi:hypothetical protein
LSFLRDRYTPPKTILAVKKPNYSGNFVGFPRLFKFFVFGFGVNIVRIQTNPLGRIQFQAGNIIKYIQRFDVSRQNIDLSAVD